MSSEASDKTLPLDEVMLAMDVVDTLRHRQDLVARELNEEQRESQLLTKLKDIYHAQGIEVPDHILREGVAALNESRFTYEPPRPGFKTLLARLYVSRVRWGRWAAALLVIALLGFAGYQFAYRPFIAAQMEAARVELSEETPARMQAAYDAIFQETKVQTPVETAGELLARGRQAASEGDRERAEAILAEMTELRDQLRREYVLRVVNREGEDSGFWTFPDINNNATNYYIVVEAVTPEGDALSLPIANEESGEIEVVEKWGVRVPQEVYNAVAADKRDDGIVQRNVVGRKIYGYLDVEYVVPVLGGALTRW